MNTPGAGKAGITARYARIHTQLTELFVDNRDPQARMATIAAVLHHKMPKFFWTGFYRLVDGDLVVGPYQGPLACALLERGKGVCWACVNASAPIVVQDVEKFPGHIPCDSRSRSEVVVPVLDSTGTVRGVLDVDSTELNSFTDDDAAGLQSIADLVYMGL